MQNVRLYGSAPYTVAVVHGGPGAPGSMAPVARALAAYGFGVLEPLQTAASVDGQVNELYDVLRTHGKLPITLIGWSWGAMLGFITTARHPDAVRKLILVSSGVYENQYAPSIMETRLSRLNAEDRAAINEAFQRLDNPDDPDRDAALAFIGSTLKTKTDSCDLMADPDQDVIEVRSDIHNAVWAEASTLRECGELVALGRSIRCSVVAIHGDYDPHPVAGIQEPLSSVLDDFRLITLNRCGHYPWQERYAREAFFALLRQELGS
jgi:pimeloyl-ACP methyl ester carboxylesterase